MWHLGKFGEMEAKTCRKSLGKKAKMIYETVVMIRKILERDRLMGPLLRTK